MLDEAQERRWLTGLAPVIDSRSRVLILGSMPSASSLAQSRYYAHPRNAFWSLLFSLCEPDAPAAARRDYAACLALLFAHGIALWDVIHRCQRPGSLDAKIITRSVQVNDFSALFCAYPNLTQVFFNGAKAEQLFFRHGGESALLAAGLPAQRLSSSSAANARLSWEQKRQQWHQALAQALSQ